MRGTKQHNKIRLLLWCCVLLCSAALCCPAAFADELCSLRVTLLDGEMQPVPEIRVEVCRVSHAKGLADEFSGLSISVEELAEGMTAQQAGQVFQYVLAHGVQGTVGVTDSAGQVDFEPLAKGVYLVFERGGQAVSFQPYLVQLPTVSGGVSYYTIHSTPKVISTDSRSITVRIRWDDNDNAAGKRPQNVDVILTRGADGATNNSAFRRVTLNPQCNWQHTFSMLPLSGSYGVLESQVAEYEYLGCEAVSDGYILTYRYRAGDEPTPPTPPEEPSGPTLPQTGPLMWPVYLMVLGGILVVLGLADLCVSKESLCGEE